LKDGLRHGKGTEFEALISEPDMRYKVYNGDWIADRRHGKGIEYTSDGEISYEGDFKDDLRNGKGVEYRIDGTVCYDGEWYNGTRHGKGIIYIDIQKFYQGDFKNGEMHGKGTQYNDDGTILFDGEYKEGIMVNGKLYYDELIYEGEILNEMLYKGEFRGGELVTEDDSTDVLELPDNDPLGLRD
jgi:antitoxin component YwqK of YwqJK toxin-antitoxin module